MVGGERLGASGWPLNHHEPSVGSTRFRLPRRGCHTSGGGWGREAAEAEAEALGRILKRFRGGGYGVRLGGGRERGCHLWCCYIMVQVCFEEYPLVVVAKAILRA